MVATMVLWAFVAPRPISDWTEFIDLTDWTDLTSQYKLGSCTICDGEADLQITLLCLVYIIYLYVDTIRDPNIDKLSWEIN